MSDRERLRETFGRAAGTYHEARPDYPHEIMDLVVGAAGLRPGARVLEIGAGTGKATVPLAERGLRVTAVELSPELAVEARRHLAGFADVEVVVGDVEAWAPSVPAAAFDAVVCATAWHWIDPAVRYRLAHRLLREGGHLALWTAAHVVPDGGDPFFADIQDVYDEIGEGLPPGTVVPRPGELETAEAEIAASGLFDLVLLEHVDWEVSYDADGYLALLDTFSGHIAMAPEKRERLYAGIRRRLAARTDGRLRRHWGAVVHVARRR